MSKTNRAYNPWDNIDSLAVCGAGNNRDTSH
jgi:hypothetical protein